MHDHHREVGEPECEPRAGECLRDRQRQHEVRGHSAEQQQAPAGAIGRDGVREPRVAGVHPPDHAEHQSHLREAAQVGVQHEHARQLRDGEDEDEVEEQLERRDALRVVHDPIVAFSSGL